MRPCWSWQPCIKRAVSPFLLETSALGLPPGSASDTEQLQVSNSRASAGWKPAGLSAKIFLLQSLCLQN